ncbi:MAG: hypothetical protein WCJ59_01380 [bacterium]
MDPLDPNDIKTETNKITIPSFGTISGSQANVNPPIPSYANTPIPSPTAAGGNLDQHGKPLDWSKYYKEETPGLKQNANSNTELPQNFPTYNNQPMGSVISNRTSAPVRTVIRTYKNDVLSAVKYDHLSSVDVAVAEQRKHLAQQVKESTSQGTAQISKLKIFAIIFSITLFLAGIAVLVIITKPYWTELLNPVAKSDPSKIQNIYGYQLIKTDTQQEIDLTKISTDKLQIVVKSRIDADAILQNSIQEYYFTTTRNAEKNQVNANSIKDLLYLSFSSEISRQINPAFIFGIHKLEQNNPFFIFQIKSYDETWNSMLNWEYSSLQSFRYLFSLNNLFPVSNAATGITTFKPKFETGFINNTDVRLVKNPTGRIVFLYAFAGKNKNNLVFTTSEKTMSELIDRLRLIQTIKQ